MLSEANNIIEKFKSGEIDPDEAGQDLYAMYALLTDANFKKEAKQIAKIAHDVYHDDNLGEWDDEYIPDEKLEQIKKDLKKDLETPDNDNIMTAEEYSPANEELRLYINKIYGDGPFTVEELKEYENEFDDYFNYGDEGLEELDEILYGDKQKDKESKSTNLGGIAKALTANDLGRSL